MSILTRRNFFCAIAAPAIVRITSIMPVKVIDDGTRWSPFVFAYPASDFQRELAEIARKALLPRIVAKIYATPPMTEF